MPQPVTVHKEYAERVWDALTSGEPVEPHDPAGYSRPDLMTIAAACFFAVMQGGPGLLGMQPGLTAEQEKEAATEHVAELASAIIFLSSVIDVLVRGEYDEAWEPRMRCMVVGPPGEAVIQPFEGWKTEA